MSEQLSRSAEITKLARLLEVDAKELAYLEDIPSTALGRFREQVTDRLFGGDAERLSRVAAASKLIPIPLAAKISQIAFGPLLCAATAGLLEPSRASKISAKVPIPFLADIATMMDPRRAAAVIAAVPTPVVVAVGKELIRRDEYVTMGRFVSFLPAATLRAAINAIPSDAALLRTAFVLEGKDRLDELLEIARDRRAGILRTANEQDLWGEALDLIGHLDVEHLAELGDIAATQDADLQTSLIRAAQRMAAWPDLLPVIAAMSGDSLDRLAALPVVVESEVLRDIVDAALAHDLWPQLLPLSRHLPEAGRAIVAARLAEEDDATLSALAEQAHDAQMWDAMLPIALGLSSEDRIRLARLPLLQRDDVLRATIETAARHDQWDTVLPLVQALPEETKPRLAACLGELDRDQLLAGLEAAARSDHLVALVDVALRQNTAGRERVLALVASTDDLEDFGALLTEATPQPVWDALVEVKDEMPPAVRDVVRNRAAALGRESVVTGLAAPGAAGAAPRKQARPRPRRAD